jgi:Leucine-rich repeat (LRR) protein
VDFTVMRNDLDFSALSQVSSLVKLSIHGFKMKHMQGIGELRNLEKISLDCCLFTTIPSTFSQLMHLEEVELIGNFFLNNISNLAYAENLRTLKLHHYLGESFPFMPSLQNLSLMSFSVNNQDIAWFPSERFNMVPNLKKLEWVVPSVRGSANDPRPYFSFLEARPLVDLADLQGLFQLEHLTLKYATLANLPALQALPHLQVLELEKCLLPDAGDLTDALIATRPDVALRLL